MQSEDDVSHDARRTNRLEVGQFFRSLVFLTFFLAFQFMISTILEMPFVPTIVSQ